jgi:hypothetical protein
MNTQQRRNLKHLHDLLGSCPIPQRIPHMQFKSRLVKVRRRDIERTVNQFFNLSSPISIHLPLSPSFPQN